MFSFVVDGNGTMLFDVNGVGDWEVFLADIDVTKELWLVFEVMGVIWSLEFAGKYSIISYLYLLFSLKTGEEFLGRWG